MIDQQKATESIEQLWYTWSDVGLDAIRAGFRVRAASAGLQDIRSQRVQNLDFYQRYSLPQDAKLDIPIEQAPVCLAFIMADQERILLQKVYTGRDKVGRYGVFFIHLLVDLPEHFSARDAITLWKSKFWQRSDPPPNQFGTSLRRVSPQKLEEWSQKITPPRQNVAKIQQYLPYLIQAYLTKKPLPGENSGSTERQKLYLAGSDDDIAQLLSGLTNALRDERLLRHLTFSTFEHDVTQATTEIVGTCWLSVPGAERDPHVGQLLPPEYYWERLALNCYTGECSPLENNPLVRSNPLAIRFAQDATIDFLQGGTEDFVDLFNAARDYEDLDFETFLQLYDSLIVKAQNPDRSNLEFVLKPRSRADCKFSARMLAKHGYQKALLAEIVGDPEWWQKVCQPALVELRKQSTVVPELGLALTQLAQRAIPEAVAAVKRVLTMLQPDVMSRDEAMFLLLTDVMYSAAPPHQEGPVWLSLLWELVSITTIFPFFRKHWQRYAFLLKIWPGLLPQPSAREEKRLRPLFAFLTWGEFGAFLKLGLPAAWNELADRAFAPRPALNLAELRAFLNLGLPAIWNDVATHAFLSQALSWGWTEFRAFLNLGLPAKWNEGAARAFLSQARSWTWADFGTFLNLGMPPAINKEATNSFLTHLPGWEGLADFEQRYHPAVVKLFQQLVPVPEAQWRRTTWQFFRTLATNNYRQRLELLFLLLDSEMGREAGVIEHLLGMVHLSLAEQVSFLKRYGPTYLYAGGRHADIILELFGELVKDEQGLANGELVKHKNGRVKMDVLFSWLNALFFEEKLLTIMLKTASLNVEERRQFLQRYGENYIKQYPRSTFLLRSVWDYLEALQITDISSFKKGNLEDPTEHFLRFLQNSPFSQQLLNPLQLLIQDWCVVGEFVRRPSLANAEGKQAAESIGRLLALETQPAETRGQLLQELAGPCVPIISVLDEQEWPKLVNMLHQAIPPQYLEPLFSIIAVSARKSLRQRRYDSALLQRWVRSAFHFQKPFPDREVFLFSFLDILLKNAETKALQGLRLEAKKWSDEEARTWQRYQGSHPFLFSERKVRFHERFLLWRERNMALLRMRRPLQQHKARTLACVGRDYMTTLLSYDDQLPADWSDSVESALDSREAEQEQKWKRYLPPTQPGWLQLRWERFKVFRSMRQALKSERIGRIVRVATDHMPMLEAYHTKLNPSQWGVIHAAYTFYHAFEEAEEQEDLDMKKERALIQAWDLIEALYERGDLAPKLTVHELRRVEAAIRFVEAQQASKSITTK
jgi:hypothetical protein